MINLHRIDPMSLRLFVNSIDAGSLTEGARSSDISLAAASKRMADLEHHFQISLMVRSKRGVVATPAGQSLYQHAVEVLARLEQMSLSMQDFESGVTGQLRLWANATSFAGFLPSVLARYAAQHPNISLDVEDVLSEEAVRAVTTGVTELAIIGENTRQGDLQTIVCEEDDLVLLLRKDHPLARHPIISLEQALEHDFVTLARSSSLTRLISSTAQRAKMPIRIRIQVRSFEAMCQLIAVGLGISLIPSRIAVSHAPALDLAIRPIQGPAIKRRLLMAMRGSQQLSRPAQAFLDMVTERYAQLQHLADSHPATTLQTRRMPNHPLERPAEGSF